jgi:hypothetical protein
MACKIYKSQFYRNLVVTIKASGDVAQKLLLLLFI